MGHATIQMTFDTYGHPFKDTDADQRAAEDI
jgi:integrase